MDSNPGASGHWLGDPTGAPSRGLWTGDFEGRHYKRSDVNAIRAILNIALEDNPSTCYTGKKKVTK